MCSCSSAIRQYVSREVQTVPNASPHENQPSSQPKSLELSSRKVVSQIGSTSNNVSGQAFGSPTFEDAYIHSQVVDVPKQTRTRIGTGCNLPTASRRIVSLPSAVESVSSTPTTQQTRVVSMPESLLSRTFLSFGQPDLPFSPENGYETQMGYFFEHEKSYPEDVARVPSPPSSPESIMIIANSYRVAKSSFPGERREEWVNWASSPPRPIPALHGPLSLPYARCPSGAEGTVIEGQDLSHKIWGLGGDDAHGNMRLKKQKCVTQQILSTDMTNTKNDETMPIMPKDFYEPRPPVDSLRDTIIDLSNPITFNGNTREKADTQNYGADSLAKENLPRLGFTTSFKHGNPQSRKPQQDSLAQNNVSLPSDNYPSTLKVQLNTTPRFPRYLRRDTAQMGLGIPEISVFQRPPREIQNLRLNKAAPAFVPATNTSGGHQQRPIEANISRHLLDLKNYQWPMMNQASHLWNNEYSNLLTPPSTSSSQWTPVFSLTTPDLIHELPNDTFPDSLTGAIVFQDAKIYSPQVDTSDYAVDIVDIRRLSTRSNKDTKAPLQTYHSDSTKSLMGKAPVVIKSTDNEQMTSTPTFGPPIFSRQRPRSIPLAKLIQRKLSCVAEDDTSLVGMGKLPVKPSSFMEKPQLSTDGQLVAYRPTTGQIYGLHDAKDDNQQTLDKKDTSESINHRVVVKLPRTNISMPCQTAQPRIPCEGETHPIPTVNKNGKEDKASITGNRKPPNLESSEKKGRNKNRRKA